MKGEVEYPKTGKKQYHLLNGKTSQDNEWLNSVYDEVYAKNRQQQQFTKEQCIALKMQNYGK